MLLLNTHYDDDAMKWNAARHILAAHHLFCYLLNESDGASHISPKEWAKLTERKLMKPDEIKALDAFTGFKPALPLAWALKEIQAGPLGQRNQDHELLAEFRRLAFTFRGHCGTVANWMAQEVPFPYLHALTLLLVVNMILIGYALATMADASAWNVVVYVLLLISFIGLKEIAVAMSNPFGDDEIDFDLEAMLKKTYNTCVSILKDRGAPSGADLTGLSGNPITESGSNGDKATTAASLLSDAAPELPAPLSV